MTVRWWLPRDLPWATAFPLPEDTAHLLVDQEVVSDNPGLVMDRLLAYSSSRSGLSLVRELTDRSALVADYTRQADLLDAWRDRWLATAQALNATTFVATPEWRVVVGLGTHKVLDGGITLHPVYGAPIVPATALKGMTRLYAERVLGAPADQVTYLFGQAEPEAQRGDLIFLDAIPLGPPRMERDVANPLYAAYYGDPENVPPADYLAPRPIFFLTVGQGSRFIFGLGSLSRDADAVAYGVTCMHGALQDLGIGAKTSAGYGYWRIEEEG